MRLLATMLALGTAGADLQLVQISMLSPDVNDRSVVQPHAGCRTPAEGDECFEMVMWAMQTGIVENPDWFAPLTKDSSFEDFQRHTSRLSGACPEPCGASAPEECRTSIEGDECYEKVTWAMRTGVVERPDWYASLTNESSFEDFQRFLNSQPRLSHVCPKPCASAPEKCHTSVEGDACYEKVVWAMRTGVVERPDWYPSLTNESSLEDFQRFLHGQARLSHVCPKPCASVREKCQTSVEGDACYEKVVWAMRIGVVENSDWYPSLTKDSSFEDVQRFLHGQARLSHVCPKPCSAREASVGSGTSAPTVQPVRTIPPGLCDVTSGYDPSSFYPCMCGPDICETNQICSADSCAPIGFLKVEWPCSNPAIGSSYFSLSGVSATGAPIYSNSVGNYIYWDASCDGSGSENQYRWILDQEAPNTTASMDLDSDGDCVYFGHHVTSEFHGVPMGNSTWTVACDDAQSSMTVAITPVQSLPTPAPTLEPGVPCACGSPCGGFFIVDIDGDGCLSLSECARVDELAEHFADMDADGDSCVTQEECAASPFSELLPSFQVAKIPECGYGFHTPEGASVCVECDNGETRRRRSSECTECPPGKFDPGDFDDCISGAYLMELLFVGDDVIIINQGTDEYGNVMTRGVEVIIATRSPGHWQKLTIADAISTSTVGVAGVAAAGAAGTATVSFRMTGPAVFNFSKYDPVVVSCTGTADGLHYSDVYPCGCGAAVCQQGEKCDIEIDGQGGYCRPALMVSNGHGGYSLPTPSPTVSARGDPHLVNLQGEHFDVNHEGEFTLLRIPQDKSIPAEMELKATILPEHGKPCTTYITEVELSGAWLGGRVVQVRSYRAKAEGEAGKFFGIRLMRRGATAEAEPEENGAVGEVPWERLADWPDMTYLLSGPQAKTGYIVTLAKTQWNSKKNSKHGASSVAGQVEVQVQRRRYNESTRLIMRQDLPLQEHLNLAVRHISALGRQDVGGLLGFDPHPESLEAVSPECQRHRDGLDGPQGPRFKPSWKIRWEKIKEQRGQTAAPGGGMNDNEAAASLATRAMMCVCAVGDASRGRADGRAGGGGAEGVLAEFQTGRLAEATWD